MTLAHNPSTGDRVLARRTVHHEFDALRDPEKMALLEFATVESVGEDGTAVTVRFEDGSVETVPAGELHTT